MLLYLVTGYYVSMVVEPNDAENLVLQNCLVAPPNFTETACQDCGYEKPSKWSLYQEDKIMVATSYF